MNAYAGVPADEVVNNNYLKNLFLGKNIYFWEKIFEHFCLGQMI